MQKPPLEPLVTDWLSPNPFSSAPPATSPNACAISSICITRRPTGSASSSTTCRPNRRASYEAFPAPEAHRSLRRLELHRAPKHASWLNMVEIEIGGLRSQCLDRGIADRQTPRGRDRCLARPAQRRRRHIDYATTHKSAGRPACQSPLYPYSDQIPRRREMMRWAITGSRLRYQKFGRARCRVVRRPSMAARRGCSVIRPVPQGAGPACTFPGIHAGRGRGSLRAARRETPDRSA
jgi:hypothetical protein